MTIIDEPLLRSFREQPYCAYCGRQPQRGTLLDAHHVFLKRGIGGGSRIDHQLNLIALCRFCHESAEAHAEVNRDIQRVVAQREKMTCEQIVDKLYEILRTPK